MLLSSLLKHFKLPVIRDPGNPIIVLLPRTRIFELPFLPLIKINLKQLLSLSLNSVSEIGYGYGRLPGGGGGGGYGGLRRES